MNIGEIKRYINDGLQPLSTLIGTAEDAAAKIGSLVNTIKRLTTAFLFCRIKIN